jgi:2,3-bisphosphoglycerate-dependent phosphoglycerate mutase
MHRCIICCVNYRRCLSSNNSDNKTLPTGEPQRTVLQPNGANRTTSDATSRPVMIKERARRSTNPAPRSLVPSTTKVLSSGHPAHHFMSGGMPCDPAPPPYSLAEYGEESLYTLILLRHGESEWNQRNWYTGWCDVNLTERGEEEARTAGRLLLSNGIEIDQAFTSVLRRASRSCQLALDEADQHWVPVTKTWRLNERHYGALQGYHKDTAYQELQLDQELVMQMRRAYDVRPPRMDDSHPYWHGLDRRYQHLTPEQLERSRAESLKDAADRILPFFHSVICPSIQSGKKCLIVSHANTIRTLVKHIDNISDEDIKGMTIPTGIPLLYRLDKDLKPVDPHIELEFRYMVEPKGYVQVS